MKRQSDLSDDSESDESNPHNTKNPLTDEAIKQLYANPNKEPPRLEYVDKLHLKEYALKQTHKPASPVVIDAIFYSVTLEAQKQIKNTVKQLMQNFKPFTLEEYNRLNDTSKQLINKYYAENDVLLSHDEQYILKQYYIEQNCNTLRRENALGSLFDRNYSDSYFVNQCRIIDALLSKHEEDTAEVKNMQKILEGYQQRRAEIILEGLAKIDGDKKYFAESGAKLNTLNEAQKTLDAVLESYKITGINHSFRTGRQHTIKNIIDMLVDPTQQQDVNQAEVRKRLLNLYRHLHTHQNQDPSYFKKIKAIMSKDAQMKQLIEEHQTKTQAADMKQSLGCNNSPYTNFNSKSVNNASQIKL